MKNLQPGERWRRKEDKEYGTILTIHDTNLESILEQKDYFLANFEWLPGQQASEDNK